MRILILFGLLLLGSIAFAQLTVDVALVDVVATVTDDAGRYVPDLKADDFVLEEDGKVQTISHLNWSTDLPVSVGIVLDTSGSMEGKIGTAKSAVDRFVRRIHEDDDIFLMTFSDRVNLRQDFTADRSKLTAALRKVDVDGGTALYDALDDGLAYAKKGRHSKKAILLITDGVDTDSRISFQQTLEDVRKSEMLVYALGIAPASGGPMSERGPTGQTGRPGGPPVIGGPGGQGGPGGPQQRGPVITLPGGISIPIPGGTRRFSGAPAQQWPSSQTNRQQQGIDSIDMEVLDSFADSSGGRAWLVPQSTTAGRANIERILDQIADELRSQYSIGYYPQHPSKDGKWHRVEVRAKNPRYHVRARKDYFGN